MSAARQHGRRIVSAAACLLTASSPGLAQSARAGCPGHATETVAIAHKTDAASFALSDGREITLSTILPPTKHDVAEGAAAWLPEVAASSALLQATGTGTLGIAPEPRPDRYGRRRVQAFAVMDGAPAWVQAGLVEKGHARVAPLPGETACVTELLHREAGARVIGLGLWSNPAYAVRDASATRELNELSGTFQIVEGSVTAVGETRRRIYLNFGDNWRWDFTASLELSGSAGERQALTQTLKSLRNRRVRVRGWLTRRNGPSIDLSSAAVIEDLSGPVTASDPGDTRQKENARREPGVLSSP